MEFHYRQWHSASNAVNYMIKDSRKTHIWVATREGISRYSKIPVNQTDTLNHLEQRKVWKTLMYVPFSEDYGRKIFG